MLLSFTLNKHIMIADLEGREFLSELNQFLRAPPSHKYVPYTHLQYGKSV